MNLSDFTRFYENALTDIECDSIIKYYKEQQEETSSIVSGNGDGVVDTAIRDSKIVEIERGSITDLLVCSVLQKCIEAYTKHLSGFKINDGEFSLLSFLPKDAETAPFLINRYEKGGFYNWHTDQGFFGEEEFSTGIQKRIISILIYLNDDFEGGRTELPFGHFVPKKGCVAIFPSNWMFPHTSTPITKGEKYSIATWLVPKLVV